MKTRPITCNQCGTDDCEHLTADSPPVGDVIQREPDIAAVPVAPVGTTQVEQVPRRLGTATNKLLETGAGAFRFVGDDPRRQRVSVACTAFGTAEGIIVSSSEAEARHFLGMFLSGGSPQVRYDFEVQDALWVRPVDVALGVLATSSGPVLFSWLTEMWTR